MNLQLVATCLAADRTAGVSVRVSASLPRISSGSFALLSYSQTAWLPDAISPRTVALLPRCVQPQVRSAGVPMLKIFARFLLTAFKMRALSTGAQVLGFTPTKRMRSASSMDSICELKRQSARNVLLSARLLPLRNQQLKELSEFKKSLKAWMFYTDSNYPTAPAMSLPSTLSILAAIIAMASYHDCSAKSAPFLRRGTLSRCLLSPSQAWRDLSESHSSLMASWTRGLTRMMLFSLQSRATLLPIESIRSMESLVSSSQGREVQAKGPLLSAPTGQTSARLPLSSEWSIFSTQVLISVPLPLPEVPRSWKPPISSAKRMQRVQWMHLFMWVTTSGPTFLSCTARLYSSYLPAWKPQKWELFCRSHSPPWSQMGQSRGWLASRNSITPPRASRATSELVLIFMAGATCEQQEATGLGDFSTSTRHILQLPATFSRSWQQKRGISMPFSLAAWKMERLLSTWQALLLMKISIFLVEKRRTGRCPRNNLLNIQY